MSGHHPLVPAFDGAAVPLGEVLDRQVELLREAQRAGQPVAAKLLRGTGTAPPGPELTLETARLAIARDHGYADWAAAREQARIMVDTRFEAAADAIQWGELTALHDLLGAYPALVRTRSPFPHHATLLHHVAANGIEVERQLQSPPNAPAIMRLLGARRRARRVVRHLRRRAGPDHAGLARLLVRSRRRGRAK